MRQTVILGAGLAGMSTAYHLGGDYEVFERQKHPGGLVTTRERDGFFFDQTGHWLHMRDAGIRELVARQLPHRMVQVERDSRIFSKGVLTPYPFQTNTHGLPVEVVKEIIQGFVEAVLLNPSREEPQTFADWVLRYMGPGIAKHFMLPYNRKLWCTDPADMTPHWCQHYVPKPTLDQLLDGALRPPRQRIGYNASFVYPATGGIGRLSTALASALDADHIQYKVEPTVIHAKKRSMTLSNGETIGYRNLVSSIPLPELIKLIADAPQTVRRAAERLVHNQVAYYNIAVDGPVGNPAHWVYYAEEPFVFYRAGCYSNAVPSMAPKDKASLYVEISHRGDLPNKRSLWNRVLKGLLDSGLLPSREALRFYEFHNIPYAYVVFDRHYAKSLAVIHPWLKRYGIQSIGRYGRWTYNSMETAMTDGREAATLIQSA